MTEANPTGRLPALTADDLTPEQKRVHDLIADGPRGRVPAPFWAWLRSPNLAEPAQALGAQCRYRTSLPPRLSELAILVTAYAWRAPYEWAAHAEEARKAGLGEAVIAAIGRGETPAGLAEDEAAVHAFAREAQDTRRVSDKTYSHALAKLGERGVVDLTMILGYYCLISLTLNVFRVPAREGATVPFAVPGAG
jgi:4-carboxymuconolactone decarboxylase